MFQHILIPIDGSKLSATALDLGMELARDAKARDGSEGR
ncbi:universal stress protein [Pararhizobium sp. LjRoot235]